MSSLLSADSRLLQLTGNTLYILVRPPHPFGVLRFLHRTAIDLAISSHPTPSRTHLMAALQAGPAERA